MNGKGDKNRTGDYKSFNKNYDKIQWGKTKKTFKTSWDVEYDIWLDEEPIKKDDTPTIKDLINK